MTGAAVPTEASALHALGSELMRIANGENACEVLGQTKHGAAPKTREHMAIADIYWRSYVQGAEKTEAIAAVKKVLPKAKQIYSVAQRYRKHFLGTENAAGAFDFDDDVNQAQVWEALRRIAKHNRRGRD